MPSSGKAQPNQADAVVEVLGCGTSARCQSDVSSFESSGFSVSLYPSVKGSLQCFCHGAVVKMLGHYGWLFVFGKVEHPLAGKRGGLIYVSRDDVVPGRILRVGDTVTFYLYVDGMGLGAEVCDISPSVNSRMSTGAFFQQQNFGASTGKLAEGDSRQDQCTFQPSLASGPVYYLPVGFMIANAPYACTDRKLGSSLESAGSPDLEAAEVLATGESWGADTRDRDANAGYVSDSQLPSVGSAGHSDGSCKRCAFFPKGRCLNGVDCNHCHLDHTPRQRLRKCRRGRKQEVQTQSVSPRQVLEEGAQDLPFDDSCEFMTRIEAPLVSEAQYNNDTSGTSPTPSAAFSQGPSHKSVCDVEDQCVIGSIDYVKDCGDTSYVDCVEDGHSETMAPSASVFSDDDDMSTSGCGNDKESNGDSSCPLSDQTTLIPFDDEHITFREPASAQAPSEKTFHVEHDLRAADTCCRRHRLASSPLSWSAQQRSRKAGHVNASSEVPSLEVARMARALLNKLTKERFESLSNQLLALPLSTHPQLAAVAAEIFETATTQDGFRSLYVDMCMRLDTHVAEMAESLGGKAFRKALVNECQKTFEQSLQPQESTMFEGMTRDERFEVESKMKTRRLGNIRFIGELLVCRLLAHKLMIPIIHELLNGDEMALESLIALLRIVGPAFDQKSSSYRGVLQDAFATLQHKKSDKSISSRLRYQLIDLFDARASRWAPRSA